MTLTEAPPSAEEMVTAAYRSVLRRDPDPGGLSTYVEALCNGRDLLWLMTLLAASTEAQNAVRPVGPTYPHDSGPPMHVQVSCSEQELQPVWHHLARVWSGLGELDAFWSVLTEDRFRTSQMDDPERLALFWETGEGEAARLEAWLRRNGMTLPVEATCAEYGCGVGRITRALAHRMRRVLAFDVSSAHLDAARRQLDAAAIDNVELVRVTGRRDLARLQNVDLFYSVIVLQHSPPPIISDVLAHAFAGLKPGGLAFFQVPTYATDYAFSLDAYCRTMGETQEMEVHFLPQHAVFELAARHGLQPVETQPDWCIGQQDRWISTTFLFRKIA